MSSRVLSAYPIAPAAAAVVSDQDQGAAGAAVEYVRSKWRAFLALDASLLDMQHRAAVAAAAALQRGDQDAHDLAKQSVERLAELRTLHDRALRMFDQLRAGVPGLGALPVVPIALVGVALACAALVAFIFTRANAEEKIVALLEAGELTAEQAERLLHEADQPSGAESFASAAKWIVGGMVLLALWRTFGGGR